MKKLIAAILLLALAICVFAGCEKEQAEEKKLVIWTNMKVEVETIQKLANAWGQENGYTVEVLHQSPSVQKFAQAVKSPDGPDAVIGIPNDQLADYVNAGLAAEDRKSVV